MRLRATLLFIALTLAFGTALFRANAETASSTVQDPSRSELQLKIQQKTKELDAINKQLESTKENLESTQAQRKTVQSQLLLLQKNINQLDLGMQSDKATVQKLNLEIDSLNYDLKDIRASIDDKKQAVNVLLIDLQKNDSERSSLLTMFLKNNTLADSVLETQSLLNLRTQVSADIKTLGALSEQFNEKIKTRGSKKSEVELHQQNLAARKAIAAEQKDERNSILTQTKSQEAAYQQQLAQLTKQQDSLSDEIGKIEDQLRASFNTGLLPTQRPGVLAWPLQNVVITQHFGERSRLYRNKPHNGLDLGAPVGTPIFAAADGVVRAVDNNDTSRWRKYQYGKYVLIKHDNNLATLYAHLSRQVVSVGMTVRRGDLIGYSGNTGYATGPHLHFGVYWAPSVTMRSIPPAAGLVPIGVVVDPEDYL